MTLWLVRAGKNGEDEATCLDKGRVIIGWHEMPDVSGVSSYEEMKNKHAEIYPDMGRNAITNNAAQLWAFSSRIQKGDMVVLPLKTRSAIAVGKITGDYLFENGVSLR